MRIYPKPFLILALLVLALFPLPFFAFVNAQGSGFDTAEDITSSGCKCRVAASPGEIHWYKVQLRLTASDCVMVSVFTSSELTFSMDIYNEQQQLIASASIYTAGDENHVWLCGPYDGWIYIKLSFSGNGEGTYNIRIDASIPAPDPETSDCSWCTGSSGASNSGSSFTSTSSGECPCEGVPFPCHCPVPIPFVDWIAKALNSSAQLDFCYALATVFCWFKSVGEAIMAFFGQIGSFFQSLGQSIVDFFASIGSAIMNGINAVAQFFANLGNAIVNAARSIAQGIASFFSAVVQGIASFFQGIINAIKGFFGGITSALGSVGDWLGGNWLGVLGFALLVLGIFLGGWLSVLGAIILVAYAVQSGQLHYGILLFAIGAVILAFALRR